MVLLVVFSGTGPLGDPGEANGGEANGTMTTDDEDDRRRDSRALIALNVEYKKLNTFFYDYTKNISKGGTFIRTDRPLEVGTVFMFDLNLPVPNESVRLRGEVRWVVRADMPPPPGIAAGHEPGMGIRFIYESAEEREQLERRVERLMVETLGQLIYSRLVAAAPVSR